MQTKPDHSVDWARVEWVILDMDGTVLDLAYDNYFWQIAVPEHYARHRGLSVDQARAALQPRFEATRHTLPWYCTDYWSEFTGLNLAAIKRELRERITPLQGSVDFLHAVRASGRRLWLATNAHRDSWQLKLEHTGLQELFEVIACSHEFGQPKEHPAFWQGFQARHPFRPERCLFVDDSLPVLHAARAHGVDQCLAIRAPDSSAPAREIREFPAVDGLRDLLPVPPLPASPGFA